MNGYEFIAYEQEIKRIGDEKAVLAQKLDNATEKSKKISREEGIKIGEEKGQKQAKIAVARKMLTDKMDINTIAKFTGLSINKIEKL